MSFCRTSSGVLSSLVAVCLMVACQRTPPPAPPVAPPTPLIAPKATGSLITAAWTVTWDKVRCIARRPDGASVTLYDHEAGRQGCVESIAEVSRELPDLAGAPVDYRASERVVSAVGPYVSTLIDYSGYCGGAHPFSRNSIDAVNLSWGGSPVTLADVFGDTARRAVEGHDGIQAVQRGETQAIPDAPWSSPHFAFKALRGRQVIVRLGLPHAVEVDAGTIGLFDLALPVPPRLRADLDRAERAGTLLGVLAPGVAGLAEGVYRDGARER